MPINEDLIMSMFVKISNIETAVAPQLPDINFKEQSQIYIESLKTDNRINTAICYARSLNRFCNFTTVCEVKNISRQLIQQFFEEITRTVSPDAAKAYCIDLRALYNHCTRFLNSRPNPFAGLPLRRSLYRMHRILTVQELRRLAKADNLPPLAAFARDAFCLSFSLCGINICDLYDIKKPTDNILQYNRQKTANRREDRALQYIRINPTAAQFAARFLAAEGVRWLDWWQRSRTERNLLKKINRGLKICAMWLNLPPTLSTYYARHTFASIARNELNLDIFDISQALNHTPPSNTIDFIYIKPDHFKPSRIAEQVNEYCFGSTAAAAAV